MSNISVPTVVQDVPVELNFLIASSAADVYAYLETVVIPMVTEGGANSFDCMELLLFKLD